MPRDALDIQRAEADMISLIALLEEATNDIVMTHNLIQRITGQEVEDGRYRLDAIDSVITSIKKLVEKLDDLE